MADLKSDIDRILTPMIEEGIAQEDAVMLLIVGLYAWTEDHPQITTLEKYQVSTAFAQDRLTEHHAN